jgi:hypothetical protein
MKIQSRRHSHRSGDVLAAGHDEVVPKPLRKHAELSMRASRARRRAVAAPTTTRPLLAFACSGLLALAASLTLTGCASFQMWGQKTSSTPATMGGAFNIPFGGK